MLSYDRKPDISNIIEESEFLELPGLFPIKQVELYSKWVPLLPYYASIMTYPKPSDYVLHIAKEEKRSK